MFDNIFDNISSLASSYGEYRIAEVQADASGASQQMQATTVEVPQQVGAVPVPVAAPVAAGMTQQQMMMAGGGAVLLLLVVVLGRR